jgi:hypothetical protein
VRIRLTYCVSWWRVRNGGRVGTTYKEGVKRCTPHLPDPNEYVFAHGPAFREFLLTKRTPSPPN